MLSVEDNELVTNTNKGTPMGELFRRPFWIPVALSQEELPGPDCVPVKLKILNEDLIAFRDSEGRVGLIDLLSAPTAVRRCSSAATRSPGASAASTTAGSSTSPVNASTCRTRRKATPSITRSDRRLPLQGGRWHGLRLHGSERQAASLPGLRLPPTAGIEHLRHQVPARAHLAAGDRRRLRPEPRRFPT